jgi:hypothetical protein
MEQYALWQQLDLLILSNETLIQGRRINASDRGEITALLKVLIDECVTDALKMQEVVDEQDHG